MPRAFITGITGQDGSYLTEFLLRQGYEVHGLVRQTSLMQRGRLDALGVSSEERMKRVFLHYGDLGEAGSLARLVHAIQPDEIYHLGGQSHVRVSFDAPEATFDINASGTLRLLECVREAGRPVRFYHASSCEMYGRPEIAPQDERTPFHPVSPYACSKAAGHFLTVCYRESYGLFACNGILFNHESPRRGENFVTRKIAHGAVAAKLHGAKLRLGNLDARKDWGYAPEYVEAMWKMLQRDLPGDYVVATGEAHSVRQFAEAAFARVGLDWREWVESDPVQFRPSEVGLLVGNASRAEKELGWTPATRFAELVRLMVDAELHAAGRP
ncbi:MAG: GDP-mannose 4,6-dehydratase [Verrucomicrobiae bacterium]|nr:GDP-mannose 4,6-dehydratase [Verrucomicrobiae bacterium]